MQRWDRTPTLSVPLPRREDEQPRPTSRRGEQRVIRIFVALLVSVFVAVVVLVCGAKGHDWQVERCAADPTCSVQTP